MTDATPPPLSDDELAFAETIFEHARAGRTDALASLTASGLPVDLTNARGDTLLILAAYHQHAETVEMLLSAGADVDRINDMGQTALSAAVFRGDSIIVTQLLDANANPMLGARSAPEIAEHFQLPEMAVLLEQRRSDR